MRSYLVPARLEGSGDDLFAMAGDQRISLDPRLRQKAQALSSADILLGIRPESMRIEAQGQLKGEITTVEYLGRETIYRIAVPSCEILVVSQERDLRSGNTATVAFDSSAIHLFAAQEDGAD
jgi:ABC-type sugar transport system ATPase subunit